MGGPLCVETSKTIERKSILLLATKRDLASSTFGLPQGSVS